MNPLDDLRARCAAPLPHPDADALRAHADAALAWLLDHFATLPEQPIGLCASRPEMEALLREAPPEEGRAFDAVLADFADKVAPYCFRVNHPRFLAFVPSAPTFVAVLGDLLCAGTNFFAGVWLEAAGAAQVELIVLDWFKEFLGLPPETSGVLTGGGSEANLTALVVAREPLSYEERGRAVVYATELRHWSADRAAKVIGLRPDQIRSVASDDELRLSPGALRRAVAEDRAAGLRPWLVFANAGATSTGTVDPLAALADVCRDEGLWLHADAAYGWSAVLTPEGKALLDGIGRADSVTLDPHKWFGQTFEAGCILVRDGGRLARTFSVQPEYMQDVAAGHDEVNFADHGIALTRRFRALKIWLSVKVLGVGWFRALVEHCVRLADYGQALLERSPGFEIVSPRRLSIVCFRYAPAGLPDEEVHRLNLAVVEGLRATGRAFLSSTRLRGRVALRFCFVNWRTTAADVDEVVRLLADVARNVTSPERPT